jgi:hypothetical protein
MIVAMTRDGKLKVEAITDEFVTLDASTRTDVMARLDAVVTGGGDADSTYYRVHDGDDDVNAMGRGGKRRRGGTTAADGMDGAGDDVDDGGKINNGDGGGKGGKTTGRRKQASVGPASKGRRKTPVGKN